MATTTATMRDAAATRRRQPAPGWLREPLLHFVVLGAVLFAADYLLFAREEDPLAIVVTPQTDQEAGQLFLASRGREPTAEELASLRQNWIDNEILYREGLAMEVDKGDTAIRERVIFKALSIIDAGVKLPPIDPAALEQWFETRREKYDEPKRYDFQEAVLAGDGSERAVREFVDELNHGAPREVQAGLRVYTARPYPTLLEGFGADFPDELEKAAGEWRAIKTREGWRAIRLDGVIPADRAVFADIAGIVLQDWKDSVAAEQRTAAVRALAGKYAVRVATGGAPAQADAASEAAPEDP